MDFEKCSLSFKKKTHFLVCFVFCKKTALHYDVKINCRFSISTLEVIIMLFIYTLQSFHVGAI